jgi:hypothetical protein
VHSGILERSGTITIRRALRGPAREGCRADGQLRAFNSSECNGRRPRARGETKETLTMSKKILRGRVPSGAWLRAAWPTAIASAVAAATSPLAAEAADEGRALTVYGFAQADYIQDITGRLDPDWDDAFRPSKICIDGACGEDGQASLSVKQSRFGVKGRMPTGEGRKPFDFKFEFDLFGTGVDAGQTTMRLRHFYGEWGPILAGQTHSLFMDIDVFPNTIDYWGPSGMVFYRNVQLRYTPWRTESSHFAVALERPGNDVDGGNVRLIEGFEDLELQSDEELPDLTAQYRTQGDWGHLLVGGIVRKVGYESRAPGATRWNEGSEMGWGVNVGSSINTFGKDKVLLQVVYGEGIASYMNDGGMDLAPNANFDQSTLLGVDEKAVPLLGVVAYYDHWWNDRWSSSIGYSFTEVDNTNFQGADSFHRGDYASTNLLYYPGDNLMLGGELMWGERENDDGTSDDNVRFQFSVKYSFGYDF